ncbi:hypothetical protein ABT124_43375 [Streptomyces sp. NPDC001982]|uniref:hypothetical protein n=1 Tax=unclassified Streptomyces TaxID=2593676 RepID=UPI00332E680B
MTRRTRRDQDQPTVEQIRHLIAHTEYRALTPAESARRRAGVEHLIASQAGLAAQVGGLTRRLAAGTRPALDVACSTCKAPARSPCVTRFGQPTTAPRLRRPPHRRQEPLMTASPPHDLRADTPREVLDAAETTVGRPADEHTAALGAVYRERNHLAAWLVALHPSVLAPAPDPGEG